jgi:hypothetical protein
VHFDPFDLCERREDHAHIQQLAQVERFLT